MSFWRRFLNRFSGRYDGDLERELEAHLDLETEELAESGRPAEEARSAARRAVGNLTLLREDTRETWGWAWLERLGQDLRFGLRMFGRSPAFTTIAILTLALGIGANTAIFSVVHAVLLRPLPYKDPEQLVAIWQSEVRDRTTKLFAPYRDYENWRDHSRTLAEVAAVTWALDNQVLTGRGAPHSVLAIPSTVGLFDLLGVPPQLGRTFSNEDLSRDCTAVLSHRLWQSELGADPHIIGETLRLDDQSCTVIGVMPAAFVFFPEPTSLWTLITPNHRIARNPDRFGVGVFGRLKPGISKDRAESEVRVLASQVDAGARFGAEMEPTVRPLQEEFTWMAGRNLRLSLLVLFAAVSCVLLIACVNVATLLLGRSLVRMREMTIRTALGSTRGRLLRQILTENLLLSVSASILGILLAAGAVQYFRAANPVDLPPGTEVAVSLPVLGFTVALAVLTTLLFGLVPAWRASRVDLNDALKTGGRGTVSTGRNRLVRGLIALEVSLSMMLLVGAGLLTQSLERFSLAPLGFQTSGRTLIPLSLPPKNYSKPAERADFYQKVLDRLESIPGLERAALSSSFPLRGGRGFDVLIVEGRPLPTPETSVHDISRQSVSGEYFRVMDIPLHQGRAFDRRDSQAGLKTAIVNETLARKYFPKESPVGRHIRTLGDSPEWLTIVGVAGDEKRTVVYQEMGWVDSPILYRPLAQEGPAVANLLLRADGADLGSIVQQTIARLDPDVFAGKAEPVDQVVAEYLKYPRFRAVLLGSFAFIALLLAIVGLYGVLAQLVAQRTQEIGLRMAIGAQAKDILKMVVKEGMLLAGLGVGFGLVAAALLARFVASLLYGITPRDPVTLLLVSAALLLAALLAAYVPARRATKIDPMAALRCE